ncbi:MAG: DUF2304 domain-containing protein [Rhodospirillaceae bacterium]|jgi:small membrane protein|nr:DUF2304 domain-containing protein [Rhodospirillaceae bacterium]MBT4426322.1 DUF2304 domain-containing protein [Rhodospirillaceae bacterium]MBT5675911.1 DUF2304 domain-containing protein [Rhodospirillaceae bacterium]MBT5778707.1 DUF2304 domain-containing protein [Rhodospirillaceae bacterium]MBT7292133.1 DUF2304 domain-containing protein [Rhodospirillaceae bacterium]
MIIQFILTAGVCFCLLYAFNQIKRWPVSFVIALVAVAGLIFIWYPGLANSLAVWVGVSRGADLLFYIWIIISMFMILNLHIRNRSLDRKISAILREIALAKPRRPDDDQTRPDGD